MSTETPARLALNEARVELLDEEKQPSGLPGSGLKPISNISAPVKALLMGYYGVGNLGDEMMLFCLKRWLERQGFDLTVLSERPAEVSKAHGLPAIENSPLLGEWAWFNSWFRGGALRVLRAIAQRDALIVGGGDLIRDDLGWRTFFYTMEKFIVAILLRKKVYVVNMGIGQLSTWYGRALLKWVLGRCDRIIVRDARSENVCRQMGVSAQTALVPDIALSLPDLLRSRGAVSAETPGRPYVVVCLRHNPNVFPSYEMTEGRIRTLARSLDDLIERRGVDVVFIPLHANSASGRGDALLHERVAAAMLHSARIHLHAWTADLDEVCSWIRAAQFVVAMRLHAAVLALSCGRPSVLMPYDRKVREFGELMAIPHSIEATALDDPDAVTSVLEDAWHDAQNNEAETGILRQAVSSAWSEVRLTSA
jgi:polysaccharide pyruvyl transferase CsaB